jgi:hypothetical protein
MDKQGNTLRTLFPKWSARSTKVPSDFGGEFTLTCVKFLDNDREYAFFSYPFIVRNEMKGRNEAMPPHRLLMQVRTRKTDGTKFAFVNNINLLVGGITKDRLFAVLNSSNDWSEYKGGWIKGEYLRDCSGKDMTPPISFADGEFTPWDAHKIAFLFYSPFVCTLDEARRRGGLNQVLLPARKKIHLKHTEFKLKKKVNLRQLVDPQADTGGFSNVVMSPLRYSEYIQVKKGYLRNPQRPTQSLAKYVELSNEVVSAFNWDAFKAGLTIEYQPGPLTKFLSENKLDPVSSSFILPASTYTATMRNTKSPVSKVPEQHQPLRPHAAHQETIKALAENDKNAETFLCALADARPDEFIALAKGLETMNIKGRLIPIASEVLKGDVNAFANAIKSRSEEFVDEINDVCAERKLALAATAF